MLEKSSRHFNRLALAGLLIPIVFVRIGKITAQ
jgi:hypothetical protein